MQTKNTSYNCCVFENVWNSTSHTKTNAICCLHTHKLSTQASLPEWLVFAPWTNLHLRSTHKSPKHFTAKKDEVPRKLHKKKQAFLIQFCGSQKSKWTKKNNGSVFVANAVTCAVLFVDVVGLLVLQNHAENLSRQWCDCIFRFLNWWIRVKLIETCNKIKRHAVTLTSSSLPRE